MSDGFPTEWVFDVGHSTFEFSVRHMKVSVVKGAFNKLDGGIEYKPGDWASSRAWVEIDIASIDTHSPSRDEHLRGERFFDVEHYPKASFESTSIEAAGDDRFKVHGTLSVKDISKPLTFEVEFQGVQEQPDGNLRAAFNAFATIHRTDFGFPLGAELPGGGYVHSDEVQLAMYTSVRPKPLE
jgi:polyisoprenoid-binding protein YceI